ncbi:MAG: hypothetical protein AB7T49_08705 [Oligoflexales bacterium]
MKNYLVILALVATLLSTESFGQDNQTTKNDSPTMHILVAPELYWSVGTTTSHAGFGGILGVDLGNSLQLGVEMAQGSAFLNTVEKERVEDEFDMFFGSLRGEFSQWGIWGSYFVTDTLFLKTSLSQRRLKLHNDFTVAKIGEKFGQEDDTGFDAQYNVLGLSLGNEWRLNNGVLLSCEWFGVEYAAGGGKTSVNNLDVEGSGELQADADNFNEEMKGLSQKATRQTSVKILVAKVGYSF